MSLTVCHVSRRCLCVGFIIAPFAAVASIPLSQMLFHDALGGAFSILAVPLFCFLSPLVILNNSFVFDPVQATVTIRHRWFFIPSKRFQQIPFSRIAKLEWEPSLEGGGLGDLVMRIQADGVYLVTGNSNKAERICAMVEQSRLQMQCPSEPR